MEMEMYLAPSPHSAHDSRLILWGKPMGWFVAGSPHHLASFATAGVTSLTANGILDVASLIGHQ